MWQSTLPCGCDCSCRIMITLCMRAAATRRIIPPPPHPTPERRVCWCVSHGYIADLGVTVCRLLASWVLQDGRRQLQNKIRHLGETRESETRTTTCRWVRRASSESHVSATHSIIATRHVSTVDDGEVVEAWPLRKWHSLCAWPGFMPTLRAITSASSALSRIRKPASS